MGLKEKARYLDARRFVAWLEEELAPVDVTASLKEERYKRRWFAWRAEQEFICVYTADEFLVINFGILLNEVPESVFSDRVSHFQGKWSKDEREKAGERYLCGEPARSIAEDLGCSVHSVRDWARALDRQVMAA